MRTSMLPLVDIVRSDRLLADQAVDTAFASITDVFDFYGRDFVANSGHVPIIGQTRQRLNPGGRIPKAGTQNLIASGSNVKKTPAALMCEAIFGIERTLLSL